MSDTKLVSDLRFGSKSKKKYLSFIVTFLMIISVCQSPIIAPPDCGIDDAHMNNEIRSSLMSEWNSYKKWDGTRIFVRAEKQMPISLPVDFNLRVFILDTNTKTWNPITNKTIIIGDKTQEVLDKENNVGIRTISINLPNSSESIRVFYCVSGKTGEGIPVGASGGFTLYP
jgi:hypothetical protein